LVSSLIKIIIILLVLIPILVLGYIAYTTPWMLPSEIISPLRSLKDFTQQFSKSIERSSGVPLDAKIQDQTFIVKEHVTGLQVPTTMTFIDNDILVLEKNSGKVRHVKNNILQESPILDVSVSDKNEQGMLGIVSKNTDVFLYFTESETDGKESIGNNIYKYNWDGTKLINPILIKSLPSKSLWHNGGAMTVDSNGNVFAVIGDQTNTGSPKEQYRALQNNPNGIVDDTSVIFKISEINSGDFKLDYFAMGIRNSFGLAIDPITGNLWDTENGPEFFDEVNLVLPNFNSGWVEIMGPAMPEHILNLSVFEDFQYSDPEFSWKNTVAPTALTFTNSDKFSNYKDSLFVSDCMGNIYNFKLNSERDAFIFNDSTLEDLVFDENDNLDEIIFGTGFGCISDLEFGPDGNLYVVSLSDNTIYSITTD